MLRSRLGPQRVLAHAVKIDGGLLFTLFAPQREMLQLSLARNDLDSRRAATSRAHDLYSLIFIVHLFLPPVYAVGAVSTTLFVIYTWVSRKRNRLFVFLSSTRATSSRLRVGQQVFEIHIFAPLVSLGDRFQHSRAGRRLQCRAVVNPVGLHGRPRQSF